MFEIEIYFVTVAALAGFVTLIVEAAKQIFNLADIILFRFLNRPVSLAFTATVLLTVALCLLGYFKQYGIFEGADFFNVIYIFFSVLLSALGLFDILFRKRPKS
jgi:hypothetical protein